MAPVGRTRTPKPGSFESQTANSVAPGFSPSTTRLVSSRSAIEYPLALAAIPPGKHRGNTEKEAPGTPRNQSTPRNAHFKRISANSGKSRKPKELPSLEWHSRGQGFDSPWLHQFF